MSKKYNIDQLYSLVCLMKYGIPIDIQISIHVLVSLSINFTLKKFTPSSMHWFIAIAMVYDGLLSLHQLNILPPLQCSYMMGIHGMYTPCFLIRSLCMSLFHCIHSVASLRGLMLKYPNPNLRFSSSRTSSLKLKLVFSNSHVFDYSHLIFNQLTSQVPTISNGSHPMAQALLRIPILKHLVPKPLPKHFNSQGHLLSTREPQQVGSLEHSILSQSMA